MGIKDGKSRIESAFERGFSDITEPLVAPQRRRKILNKSRKVSISFEKELYRDNDPTMGGIYPPFLGEGWEEKCFA